MKTIRGILVLLLVAITVASCASIGTGRPYVVRAEDVLFDGPIVYDALFTLHKTPGVVQLEGVDIYEQVEALRTRWPAADRVLRSAVSTFKAGTGTKGDLMAALTKAEDLQAKVRELLATIRTKRGSTP